MTHQASRGRFGVVRKPILYSLLLAQLGFQTLDSSFVLVGLSHDAVERVAWNGDTEASGIHVFKNNLFLVIIPEWCFYGVGTCGEIGYVFVEIFFGGYLLTVLIGIESVLVEVDVGG